MGLDTSHGCWHGAYSAFNRWRTKIADLIGIRLDDMRGFGGHVEWPSADTEPLSPSDFALRVINRARVSKPARGRGPAPSPLWQRVQALTGYAAETCREWCRECGFEPGETWAKGNSDGEY